MICPQRVGKTEKVPTCIAELKWYHPFLDNCETADSLLMHLGDNGHYLIRPSSTSGMYTLSVRTKSSVKHFPISVKDEITFGLAKFHTFADFLKHFDKQPMLAVSTGEPVLLKYPFIVPKHKTMHEPLTLHAQMIRDTILDDNNKRAGYLIKQGGFVKTWKERWCILQDLQLKYFHKPDDSIPKGIIDLRDCEFCRKGFKTGEVARKENVFFLGTPWRTFIFEAATLSDLDGWVTAIQDCLKTVKSLKA